MNYAVINIKKKEAGLTEEEYRDLMFEVTGVRSAKLFSPKQYSDFCVALNELCPTRQTRPKITRPKTKTESKIWAIWYDIKNYIPKAEWTAPYLMGFVSRVIHREARSTDDLATLTPLEAKKVIDALLLRLEQEEFEYQQKTGVPF